MDDNLSPLVFHKFLLSRNVIDFYFFFLLVFTVDQKELLIRIFLIQML